MSRSRLGRRPAWALGVLGTTMATVMGFLGVTTSPAAAAGGTAIFNYTGTVQNWTVPAGVTWVSFVVDGAQGGAGSTFEGGLGGETSAAVPVTPGEILQINVGGWGLGSRGGKGTGPYFLPFQASGGGGGGASDVRRGTQLSGRLLVGGGGGGGGGGKPLFAAGGTGGPGGHYTVDTVSPGGNGGDGTTVPTSPGVNPGIRAHGGLFAYDQGGGWGGGGGYHTAANGQYYAGGGQDGYDGGFGYGGDGGAGGADFLRFGTAGGGGGGGGWYGGGGGGGGDGAFFAHNRLVSAGGGGGGGGGGESFGPPTAVFHDGSHRGNGSVFLTYSAATPTQTTLTSSANPSSFGKQIIFTATVSPARPGDTTVPAGTVQFGSDGNALGGPVTLIGGVATSPPISGLTVGLHTISATFSGAYISLVGSSGFLIQRVGTAATNTGLTSSANPSRFGQEVSFTAHVAPGAGTPSVQPTGSVQFSVNGTVFGAPVALVAGSAMSGPISSLNVDTHDIRADYGGDGNFTSSTAILVQTVTRSGTVTTLGSSANPSGTSQEVSYTADVLPVAPGAGTLSGTVQFTVDGSNLGGPVPVVNGQASSAPISNLSLGDHTVTANYSGDTNYDGSAATMTQKVDNATTTTLTSSANPAGPGQAITFTATVRPVVAGAGTPTGTVQFRSDGDALGSPINLVNGMATSVSSVFSTGDHSITAIYSGDANFAYSIGALTQTAQ